jgi:hypothetical protein
MNLCRDIFSQLGIKFPKVAVKLHILLDLKKVKSTLRKASSQDLISNLLSMDDPSKQRAMTVTQKLLTWAIMCKSDLLLLVIFKGLSITKRHLVSRYSPGMLANVGFLLTILSGFKGAQLIGDQAMALLKVEHSRRSKRECC